MDEGAVIIGASHAGVSAAAALRQGGWQEPIRLLSGEQELPYHRPPLSKTFLSGERDVAQIALRDNQFYKEQGIDLILECRAVEIDPRERAVETTEGVFSYSRLILATGARPRRLRIAGGDLTGIQALRGVSDAERLKTGLATAENVVIVGGGFIGLEVAATAVKQGLNVTLLEAQDRLLARALPASLSAYLARYHSDRGVRLRFGAAAARFVGDHGKVRAVELADGTILPADLVLVGIGSDADIELAREAGIDIAAGGILVDANGATGVPHVYAAGDCASFANRFAGCVTRIESVQNANDQARAVAAHCVGAAAPLTAVPWFWSDQYELKLQMAGLIGQGAEEIVRGDPAGYGFSILHVRGNRLAAAFTVNRAGDHMAARKMIASGEELDLAYARDPAVPLARAVATAV